MHCAPTFGVHHGPLILGTIGEAARMDSTVIADAVNVASRLEGVARQLGARVVVSAAVVSRLTEPTRFELRPLGRVRARGKQEPVEVYDVMAAAPSAEARRRAGPMFHQGLEACRRGDLEGARAAFLGVLATDPDDRAAEAYLVRLARAVADGAWDGVLDLERK